MFSFIRLQCCSTYNQPHRTGQQLSIRNRPSYDSDRYLQFPLVAIRALFEAQYVLCTCLLLQSLYIVKVRSL